MATKKKKEEPDVELTEDELDLGESVSDVEDDEIDEEDEINGIDIDEDLDIDDDEEDDES